MGGNLITTPQWDYYILCSKAHQKDIPHPSCPPCDPARMQRWNSPQILTHSYSLINPETIHNPIQPVVIQ